MRTNVGTCEQLLVFNLNNLQKPHPYVRIKPNILFWWFIVLFYWQLILEWNMGICQFLWNLHLTINDFCVKKWSKIHAMMGMVQTLNFHEFINCANIWNHLVTIEDGYNGLKFGWVHNTKMIKCMYSYIHVLWNLY